MVLPDGDLRAAEEDVLASPCNSVLFLDLDLADVAGMLDDFGDVCPVPSSDLASNTLGKIGKTADQPVLVEDAHAIAEWCSVILDHAELSVYGPEDEEDNEHVVSVPEALVIRTSRLLYRCHDHCHECHQHDIT